MKVNWWKFGSIAVMAILLFLFGRSCGIKSVVKNSDVITSVKYDTIFLTKDSIIPSKVLPPEIIYKYKKDTLVIQGEPYIVTVDEYCPIDDLNDYNKQKIYLDTTVKGLTLIDTIQHNSLKGRSMTLVRSDSIITKTTILRQPKKYVGYFNLSANRYSAAVGLSWKTKQDIIYGTGLRWYNSMKPQIELNISLPIKLRKK